VQATRGLDRGHERLCVVHRYFLVNFDVLKEIVRPAAVI